MVRKTMEEIKRMLRLAAVVLLVYALIASAAGATDLLDSAQRKELYRPGTPATVVINGREIVTFRSYVFANDPAHRALLAEERLQKILDGSFEGTVATRAYADGVAIDVDNTPAIYLSPADVDVERGQTLEELTKLVESRLAAEFKEAKEMSNPELLLSAILWSLLYVVLWAVVIRVLFILKRRVLRIIHSKIEQAIGQSKIASAIGTSTTKGILVVAERFTVALTWTLILVASYSWITLTFELYPITRPWGEGMASSILNALLWVLTGFVGALPGLATVVIIVLVTRFLSRIVSWLLGRVQRGEIELPWVERATIAPTKRIITIVLWIFAIAFSYPYLPGSSSEAFKGVSVLVGLMISFGTTGVVGQAASGFILMYSRILRIGEFVKIGEHQGTVRNIGFFNTTLSTPYREVITIPNTVILSSSITNSTRLAIVGLSASTTISIGYDTPWREVHAMLIEAAERTPGVASDPAPFVTKTALDDFYVSYKLTIEILDRQKRRETMSALHANILDVFNEHGRQIMSPHYVIDPDEPKLAPNTPNNAGGSTP